MDAFEPSEADTNRSEGGVLLPSSVRSRQSRRERIRTPLTHLVCDWITEALLLGMIIFAPWAFGTTQTWSVWTMNIAGYLLGGLLAAKWLIRWKSGYRPSRWGEPQEPDKIIIEEKGARIPRLLTAFLATLTVLVVIFTFVSALNARATFLADQVRFEYRDYIRWLPHSYDSRSTWQAFWNYLGLALFFWAARDWLLAKSKTEAEGSQASHRERRKGSEQSLVQANDSFGERQSRSPGESSKPRHPGFLVPKRVQRLLWVLCVNGALLALEGILQRLDGTNKLLWMIVPRFNNSAEAQFGPYAYRSNAATYLNLIWPVCIGFWLALRKASSCKTQLGERVGRGSYVMLLPCAVLMAAAPIFSISRGGAFVALANLLAATVLMFFASRREVVAVRAGMLSLFIVILSFSGYLGWKNLQDRISNIFVDNMSDRPEIYDNALPIAREFSLLGTGPGTFGPIYLLYKEPQQTWAAYLHDDFLETRITFGWIGLSVILLMVWIAATRWLWPGAIGSPWEFVTFIWLAMAGCFLHAKYDFPFQVYSIHFAFLLLCSVSSCLSRK